MIDIRPVVFVNGILLVILAAAMAVPAMVDLVFDDLDWRVFAASAAVTGFAGLAMMMGCKPSGPKPLSLRQAFLLTSSCWFLMSFFGALPFAFSAFGLSLADSVFEAASGLTTTGSTVIAGLDKAPRGILLWRALLNWLGGAGIIVMAVAILPILKIGGMQLFKMESSDKTDKVKPRTSQVAWAITKVYLTFTLATAIGLWLAGMTPFEAICHAFAAIATGGFSTSDSSLGNWGAAAQWVSVAGMVLGGATFVLFISPWKRNRWPFLHDSQMRWYIGFLAFFSALLAWWQWAANGMAPEAAIRHATFNVVSVVTTTGFASTDYNAWGGFAQVMFFILTFIGACTGSTTGGIKIFRWEVLFKMAGVHLKRLLHPHGIFVIDFNKRSIADAVVESVLGFVILYFFVFALFALALTLTGLDFVTSVSGSAQALANVGPGLGDIIGPAGNFKPLSDVAKWILSFEMILGRLEIFTVLALFSRSFWRE